VYAGRRLPLWEAHGPSSADPWVSVTADGSSGTFFDPGVPAVQDHVVAVFGELAERYPVNAVHVDYLRYESREWGYHPRSLQRFQEATGRGDRPAPDDAQWGAWRRQQTRDLAARIAEAVHAANPAVGVTVAGSTIGAAPASPTSYTDTRTWWDVFQAWPDWLADGLVDAVFPMNYFREHDAAQRAWFDGWVAFEQRLDADCSAARGRNCVIAVGQGAWLNRPLDSLAQHAQALQATDGAVVFSYQQNAASAPFDALLADLPASLYADPAPVPPLR
ncbi:MAG: family 10 glycosylhydrolase, partial [Actinomycetota bacterium]|nr:family 10 glycosylhydrolase [Actinomycetota bacterium]